LMRPCLISRHAKRCRIIDWDDFPKLLTGDRKQQKAPWILLKPRPMPSWRWRIGSSAKKTKLAQRLAGERSWRAIRLKVARKTLASHGSPGLWREFHSMKPRKL